MSYAGVLLKDFGAHVEKITAQVKAAALRSGIKEKRPTIYLESARVSKEDTARRLMQKDRITDGLACNLTAVEPCFSYDIFRNREAQKLELVSRWRKCLHVYQYWMHPIFGFMNARIQTWYPFNIQICLNGREWLSRQMDKAGILYQRADNCFTRINNVKRAQVLLTKPLDANWPKLWDEMAHRLNPAHREIFGDFTLGYYWTTFQSEWATDVMFKNQASLDALYPSLIHHGMTTFQSPEGMRFLGHKLTSSGDINGRFEGEVVSDVKKRVEGVRIKHRLNRNSIKAYNKAGSLLRIETPINDAHGFKVFRTKEGEKGEKPEWLPMRKGIADLHRRSEVSQKANERYLEALTVVDVPTPLQQLVQGILKPLNPNGRRIRALNPWSEEDSKLFQAIMRGEFTINGFRNRDLRALLYPTPAANEKEEKKRSARVTRQLRMLRTHGLIKKVPKSHRYHVTEKGRKIISALMQVRDLNVNQLTQLAA